MLSGLEQKICQTIMDYQMLSLKDSVLVTVSGGPDSVALLQVLCRLKSKWQLRIGVAHLNHQLRPEESDTDAAFVRSLAKEMGLQIHEDSQDVAAYAAENKLSVETAGRKVRYAFFETVAQAHGYTKIATGHTRDDNAELVLMNLLRGAATRGLSGIPPVRDQRIIRPMIQTSKNEILSFLKKNGQAFRIDASNNDPVYLRNRIRNELIPFLARSFNPDINDALDRLSQVMKNEEAYLAGQADAALAACLIRTNRESLVLSLQALSTLHPALLNRVIRQALEQVKGDLKRISLVHLKNIMSFCFDRPSGQSLDLPGQIRVYKHGEQLEIKREKSDLRQLGQAEKQARQRKGKNAGKA